MRTTEPDIAIHTMYLSGSEIARLNSIVDPPNHRVVVKIDGKQGTLRYRYVLPNEREFWKKWGRQDAIGQEPHYWKKTRFYQPVDFLWQRTMFQPAGAWVESSTRSVSKSSDNYNPIIQGTGVDGELTEVRREIKKRSMVLLSPCALR